MMDPTKKTLDLVRQALAGDKTAFLSLVQVHKAIVYSLAYQAACNPADADDIAQETFLRAFRSLPRLRKPEQFSSWLYGIAINVSHEHQRSNKPTLPLDSIPEPAAASSSDDDEQETKLFNAISSLPEKYRVPLTLFYVNDLNFNEIAAALDLNLSTARSLVHRARMQLREILHGQVSG